VIPFDEGVLAADLDIGVLFLLAVGGLIVFPVWIAGWASNNKYALLGAMRAVAQGISYEIPLVLSAMVPVILAHSMRLSDIVAMQAQTHWFVFWPLGPGLIAFVIFFICSLAEANRIPFDIPEAESELVGGVTTEYTGMRFGLLWIAEYLHTLISSAVAAAIFFGGWDGPFLPGLHWMVLKTLLIFFVIFWVRWSLVRFRSDQLMALCWRSLLPLSLGLVMLSAVFVHFRGAAF
jgi:NADH-quinone oxidoreductase subunit H